MRLGVNVVKQSIWLAALIVIATLVAGWRIAALNSWSGSARREVASRYLWLIATGIAIVFAALLPFAFSGVVGFPMRSAYVVLPGLLIFGAAILDWMASSAALRPLIRYALAPLACVVVAASLVIGVGEQAERASSWRFHQGNDQGHRGERQRHTSISGLGGYVRDRGATPRAHPDS